MRRSLAIMVLGALLAAGCATLSYQKLPRPERKHYFELEAVGTPPDAGNYAALPDSAARAEYWQKFWKAKDPTPTTEHNERYEEHLARVEFADENFPSSSFYWDDRGKIYIKFGEPSDREVNPLGNAPGDYEWGQDLRGENVTNIMPTRGWERWTYARLGRQFLFVQADVGYRLVKSLMAASALNAVSTEKQFDLAKVDRQLLEQLPRDQYHHDYGQPLDFPFGVARFGDAKGAEVWVSYSVPLAAIGYDDSTHQGDLARSIVIMDDGLREVGRDDKTLNPPDVGRNIVDAQAIDICRFSLAPGEYTVAISLEDTRTRRTGIYKYSFPVINYLRDAKGGSDLVLAREITQDTAASKFSRAGYRIVPQPSFTFKAGTTLYLYYEIYNLKPDSAKRYQAEATYYILSPNDKQARATSPALLEPAGPTLAKAVALTLEGLPEGPYVAMALVKDLATGKTRRLATSFRIAK